MICIDCKQAGEKLATGNSAYSSILHNECIIRNGGDSTWCNCQHSLVPSLDMAKMREAGLVKSLTE